MAVTSDLPPAQSEPPSQSERVLLKRIQQLEYEVCEYKNELSETKRIWANYTGVEIKDLEYCLCRRIDDCYDFLTSWSKERVLLSSLVNNVNNGVGNRGAILADVKKYMGEVSPEEILYGVFWFWIYILNGMMGHISRFFYLRPLRKH